MTCNVDSGVTLRMNRFVVCSAVLLDNMKEELCNITLAIAVESLSGLAFMSNSGCKG